MLGVDLPDLLRAPLAKGLSTGEAIPAFLFERGEDARLGLGSATRRPGSSGTLVLQEWIQKSIMSPVPKIFGENWEVSSSN